MREPPAGQDPGPPTARAAAPALLAYVGVRAVGLLILWIWAAVEDRDPYQLLTDRWDAVWYAGIAEDGYGHQVRLPDGGVHSDLAFFPLLPALERAVAAVTPLGVHDAGLLISWAASLAAAWGVYAVTAHVTGRRAAGVLLAALWGAYPTAFVQSMAYTETLFTALAAWALYAVLTGRWVWAGALALTAGLSRPSGAAVVAAVWLPALVTVWRARRVSPRLLLGVALAPLGWLAYVVYVGVRRGGPFGYFEVQAEWDNGFDGGVALLGFVWENLTTNVVGGIGLAAALVLVGWLVWLLVRERWPLALLAYTVCMVVVSLVGSGYFGSRPRLMMPAFALLLPATMWLLPRLRPSRLGVVVAVAALASGAYGAIALLGPGPP
ncbi:hypothetical protein [Streptomyces hainanensis]|uniref:Glycosyltransferase RgtA/B/C/D-like domain-containing protein n=1 Tax=Streptomyces hainanensis TaxID=402648 RepID=A0A4R4T4M3_9ACTN|nr:hypothetical protein [Streptomyces hainanensis]TDC71767.1 hypothetical protein E1283_23045 [Streptomyces hainanensis]